MTVIHKFKINGFKTEKTHPKTLADYCLNSMENNFRVKLSEMEINCSNENRKIKITRALELMESFASKNNLLPDKIPFESSSTK